MAQRDRYGAQVLFFGPVEGHVPAHVQGVDVVLVAESEGCEEFAAQDAVAAWRARTAGGDAPFGGVGLRPVAHDRAAMPATMAEAAWATIAGPAAPPQPAALVKLRLGMPSVVTSSAADVEVSVT